MPYDEVERPEIVLHARIRNDDYVRQPVPAEIVVPKVY